MTGMRLSLRIRKSVCHLSVVDVIPISRRNEVGEACVLHRVRYSAILFFFFQEGPDREAGTTTFSIVLRHNPGPRGVFNLDS